MSKPEEIIFATAPRRGEARPGAPPRKAAAALLLAALLGPALPAAAADPASLQAYALGIESGLASDSVYCILQDREGFMWFGTFGGLSRYDGESFANYRPRAAEGSLAASVVFALAEDGEGRLWVGTDGGGLARYDRARDSFELLRADPADPAALSSDRVLALGSDRRGRVWAGTGDGVLNLVEADGRRVRRILPPFSRDGDPGPGAAVRCIAPDPEGGIWAGTEGGGLLRVDEEGRTRVYIHEPADPRSLGSNVVRSLLRDSRGRLWVGLGDGGVDLFDGSGFSHAETVGAPREAVRALAEDPDSEIWVGYEDGGIGILDPGPLRVAPPEPGAAAMVRALYRDRRGLMWAGFKAGGVGTYNVRAAAFARYRGLEDGRPLRLPRGMAELSDGSVLVGTDGEGLLRIGPGQAGPRALPALPGGRAARKVYAVAVDAGGGAWIGTDGGGLIRSAPDGSARVYRHDEGEPGSLSRDVVWALLEDPDGRIWVGTEGGGLDRLDPATGKFEHFRHDPADPSSLRGSSVRALYRDSRGRLWVGTWDGGLSRLDPGARGFENYGPRPGDEESLADASVNCVFEDSEGAIWVGTGGSGIARLDEATGRFRHYHEDDGLAGSTVYGIVEDRAGVLWISTASGLSSFRREEESFYSYGAEDGLASGGFSQNAFLETSGGEIWAGGPGGVSRFDPLGLAARPAPPEVAISGIEVPGYGAPARGHETERRVVLPYDNPGLNFRVAVLDYGAPARNRYAVRLEGRQQSWTALSYSNVGTLAHLPPGEYLLRAKGANGNGVWSDDGASVAITVEPPFWGRAWFKALLAGLAAAGIALAAAARIRRLRSRNALLARFAQHVQDAREEERTIAAREVHDEIGQQLTVLNLEAYWLQTHLHAAAEARASKLAEVQSTVAAAMAGVKAMATRLRPAALDALAFGDTVGWFARDFERRTGIACRAGIEPGVPPLSDAEATALFRVLQEALSNVARHAKARAADISLRVEGGLVVLEVSDDGVGADPARTAAPDAFGVIGMRERCAALGGSLEIESRPGAGTRLTARMPAQSGAGENDERGRGC